MPLIELPPQVEPLLAAWQAIISTPPEHTTSTNEAIQDTVRLLTEMINQPDLGPEVMDLQRQIATVTEEGEIATNTLRVELADARVNMASLLRTLPAAAEHEHKEKETVPIPEKFDGMRSKLCNFITQLRLRAATYNNEQAKLHLAINCLTGDAMDQAQAYVTDNRVNLANLGALITILENAFGNSNRVVEAEMKLCTIEQENRDFAAYYAEFQRYAAEV